MQKKKKKNLDTDFTPFPEVNLNSGYSLGHRQIDSITLSMDMSLSKLQETVKDRETRHAAVHRVAKSWTRLSD